MSSRPTPTLPSPSRTARRSSGARGRGPGRLAALLGLALLAACGEDEPALVHDGRRDLLLDQQRVTLAEGFGPFTELFVEHDLLGRFNQDRPELPIPVPRECRLEWELDALPGQFRLGLSRLHVGPTADDSPAELRLHARVAGQTTQIGREPLPPVPADPDADPDRWRLGPALPCSWDLPEGAEALVLELTCDGTEPPAGAGVALLSPHVLQQRRPVPDRSTFAEVRSLLGGLPPGNPVLVPLGRRQVQGRTPPAPETELALPGLEEVGAFDARTGRHALAVAGEGGRSLPVEGARVGDRLVTALALDRRLPPGTRVRVELRDQDDVLLAARAVDSDHWSDLEVVLERPLTELELRVAVEQLDPAPVVVVEPDFALGDYVQVGYQLTAPRVGLAELRLERDRSVAWRRASVSRPSVVLLHVETLRADLVDATTPDGAPLMPHLSRLAAVSRRFTHAVAPSPWTLPSTATLLTGLYPSAHGVVHHDRAVLPPDTPTLAERAREAGVATGAIVTNDLLDPHKGYGRGFGTYAFVPLANARQVHALATAFLDDHAGRQSLLFVHGWDPHHPWDAPAPFGELCVTPDLADRDMLAASDRSRVRLLADERLTVDDPDMRFLEQTYRGEVAYWDDLLGELLDHLVATGLDATTTVIVTSDHGEEFGEHGLFGHGSQLFDESIRVPLVVARAGAWGQAWAAGAADGGTLVEHVVSTAGLHAEVLDILDVPFEREALRPALTADTSGTAFVETDKGIARAPGVDPLRRQLRAVRGRDGLLIQRFLMPEERAGDEGPAYELSHYDLAADPTASAPADGALPRALSAALDRAAAWTAAHRARWAAAGADVEQFQTLQALGYLGTDASLDQGAVPPADEPVPPSAPDPDARERPAGG